MDRRRSWPWKRKSSEKASSDSDFAGAGLCNTGVKQGEQELTKPVSFIQISLDKYEHFNALEEKVEVLNVKLNDTKEKLTLAQTDITTKEDLVKQHAKVAEEAISGWEKAETEASDLKQKLESVTLLKLAAEEQAANLDIELKECMKQIRTEKEENEKKLHDVVFAETKLWEKVKSEFEATIADFEQELRKGSAEIDALSRSLQERSVLLMKISEEKSQADAEIEILKTNIESYEKEVSSLKHELNIAARELQICNEEKNMSVKSAEAANKQHIEDVKKITKLEAECQRLRSLVRKRLPGPAALAQMKLEVESLGHGFGESKLRRLTGKSSNKHLFFSPEVNVNEVEHYQKENELLTARLIAMEEESKMLKEDLSKKDSELQTLSNRCAKKANKLHILKAHMLAVNQQKGSLKSKADISFKGSLSQNERNHSLASISEDGTGDQGSCAESWASALITQLSQLTKERHSDRSKKTQNSNQLELMDDYLEMERLAGLSSENDLVISFSDAGMDEVKNETSDDISSSVDVHMDVCKEQASSLKQHQNLDLVAETQPSGKLLSMIGALIYFVFDSKLLDSRMGVLVDEIVKILQVAQNEWPLHSRDHRNAEACCSIEVTHHYETSITHNGNLYMELENSMNQHLRSAISWIHEFVILLHKEVTRGNSFELEATREKVEEFSDSANKLLYTNLNIDSFILSLRHFFSKTKEIRSRTWVTENCFSDCVDKVTLLENGVARHDSREEKIPGDQNLLSPLISGLEVVKGPSNPSSESEAEPNSFSSEKFEKLKMERDDMELNLINCTETLENTKFQLTEIELNLAELKRQLSASQKSNDLADTQLRCMTESYKLLESREDELKAEINLLRSKAKAFESELIAERHCHQNDLAKYNGIQEQMSNMSCTKSCHSEADVVAKARRDREIAAAADKIAECQETIILLNKQLNSLHHPVEPTSKNSRFREEPSLVSYNSQQSHYPAMESDAVSSSVNQVESPQPECSSQFSTSEMESSPTPKSTASTKNPKPRPRSTSDSSLSSMLNDKPGRGFSRFFSKGKGEL